MAIDWVQIGIQTALIGGLLGGFLLTIRLRMTKWVSLGFARMMKTLTAASEDEGAPPSQGSSGAFKLGGFEITPELIEGIAGLAKVAQDLGFLKKGGGGGSGW